MRLFSKKRVLPNRMVDSVASRRRRDGTKRNQVLLERFHQCWGDLRQFREDCDRAYRYAYGDQWGDIIKYKGKHITEKNYINLQGNIALVNNIIISLVNSVSGIYSKQDTEPVCFARNRENQALGEMMTSALQCNWQNNEMSDLLDTLFTNYIITGFAGVRETYEYRDDILDSWTDILNPYEVAWESGGDPRHKDIQIIGQIHDMSFSSLCAKFVRPEYGWTVEALQDLYPEGKNYGMEGGLNGHGVQLNDRYNLRNMDFYTTRRPSDCRVYEIWTKETKTRIRCWDTNSGERYKIEKEDYSRIVEENKRRIAGGLQFGMDEEDIPLIECEEFLDEYWYFQYLTKQGDILLEGETPYEHKSHPYTIKLYPYVNGEVHSFVSQSIDQQRYINRLVTLNDFILRTGAKGVTMVPESVIPDDMTPEQFAEKWTAVDGLIIYQPKKEFLGLKPEVFHSTANNNGITEMLQIQMQMMRDVSNVQGALQGKTPASGTAASRYAMESQNATVSFASLLSKFTSFTENLASKKVKTINQYYEDGRDILINGKKEGLRYFDKVSAQDVDFVVSIRESAGSPVYRMQMNDWLVNMWQQSGGLITVEDVLENGDFAFADKLLQSIRSRQEKQLGEQMAQGTQIMTPMMNGTNG
jgi:hypothetical protein